MAGLLGVVPLAGGPAVAGDAGGAGVTVGGMKKSRLAAGVGLCVGIYSASPASRRSMMAIAVERLLAA